MKAVPATAARANTYKLIDKAAARRERGCVTGKWGAVLLFEEDWLGVTGMLESVLEGLATSLDECTEEPGW